MRQCAPDGRRQAHRLYTATKTGGQRLPRHNTSSSSPCLAMVTTTMITPGSLPPTQEEARLRMLSANANIPVSGRFGSAPVWLLFGFRGWKADLTTAAHICPRKAGQLPSRERSRCTLEDDPDQDVRDLGGCSPRH